MNEPVNIEETLWNYIDNSLDEGQRSFVDELIRDNSEWKVKYAELLEVQQLMSNHIELEEPSMRFTQNVMEEISRLYITPAAKNYINKNVIWGIGIFFLTTIIGLLGYIFGQISWSADAVGSRSSQLTNIDWAGLFSGTYMNIFIMVNIILALMLLDMYLTNRKRKIMG